MTAIIIDEGEGDKADGISSCVVMSEAQDSTVIRDVTTQLGARYSTTSALQSLQSLQYSAESVELQRGVNTTVKKELVSMLQLGLPLSASLMLEASLGIVTMSYVAPLGTVALAAAGLAQQATLIGGLGVVFFAGADALQTQATQAIGADQASSLPIIFWRGILFNLFHAIPMAALLLCLPTLLHALGRDQAFTSTLQTYLTLLIPTLFVNSIVLPLNTLLAAQNISKAQVMCNVVALAFHFVANHVAINVLGFGLCGAALSTSMTYSLVLVLLSGYIYVFVGGVKVRNNGGWVFKDSVRGMDTFAKLAYSSLGMHATEFISYTVLVVLAGFLPNPDVQQAAAAVAMDILGFLFMVFSGSSVSITTHIGIHLGGGRHLDARTAFRAVPLLHPLLWFLTTVLLIIPPSNKQIATFFSRHYAEPATSAVSATQMTLYAAFSGLHDVSQQQQEQVVYVQQQDQQHEQMQMNVTVDELMDGDLVEIFDAQVPTWVPQIVDANSIMLDEEAIIENTTQSVQVTINDFMQHVLQFGVHQHPLPHTQNKVQDSSNNGSPENFSIIYDGEPSLPSQYSSISSRTSNVTIPNTESLASSHDDANKTLSPSQQPSANNNIINDYNSNPSLLTPAPLFSPHQATASPPSMQSMQSKQLVHPQTEADVLEQQQQQQKLNSLLRTLLYIIALHLFFDGFQATLGGVFIGAGLQVLGLYFNLVSFVVVGIPTMLLLGFTAGMGAVGMFLGLMVAPVLQCVMQGIYLLRVDWSQLSISAVRAGRLHSVDGGGFDNVDGWVGDVYV